MGKLADLASVKTANSASFVYTPPDAAIGAVRILVKPNLGYLAPPPAVVSTPVLAAVLRGLRRASPKGRIVIMEGVTTNESVHQVYQRHGIQQLLDDEMRLADAEELTMIEYENISPAVVKYPTMIAPNYIAEYDCVISLGAFKRTMLHDEPLISASLKNLYGVFPRAEYSARSTKSRGQLHRPSVPEILRDVYFSVGRYFHGAVVDLTQKYVSADWKPDRVRDVAVDVGKVVWGDDLLAVDETACRLAGEAVPDYIRDIRRLRDQLASESAS